MPSAGCATRVSVSAAACAARSRSENAAAGSMVAAHRVPRSSSARSRGNARNSSPSMPGRWLPWPGHRNATALASTPPASATNSPRRSPTPASACSSLARRSSRSSATIATCTGPLPLAHTARARSRRRGGGCTAIAARSCSTVPAIALRSSPRNKNSSAGHASRPAPRVASWLVSTAWKLVPPNPNALTAATRCAAVHGRAASRKRNGLVAASHAGFGVSMWSVGGSTP